MKTRVNTAVFNERSLDAPQGYVSLTNHMFATYCRFDMRKQYHLNSDGNRLSFITWYLLDYAPGRQFNIDLLNSNVLPPLLTPIQAAGPVNLVLHHIWKTRFASDHRFNIYTEHGYREFACHLLTSDCARALRDLIPPGMIEIVSRRVIGDGNSAVSVAAKFIWDHSPLYKHKYPDLHDWATREALNFDIIVHKFGRDNVPQLISPDMHSYWSAPIFKSTPALSRFIGALAALSTRYGSHLPTEEAMFAKASEIVDWFWDEVVPEFPQFAELAGTRTADRADETTKRGISAEDRLTLAKYHIEFAPGDSEQEIDLLLIGPFGASSGLGTGTRRSVGALQALGCNFRVVNCLYDNPSTSMEPIPPELAYKGERPKITLWHFNAEYLPDVLLTLAPFINPRRNVGYYFWETEAMPLAHKLGGKMVDEIWVPSDFVRLCYSVCDVPVYNVGTSVDLPVFDGFLPRSFFGLRDEFTFMFSFDSHSVIHRKNPAAVVRAFQAAFPDTPDVKLILKTQNFQTAHWGSINGRNEELYELCGNDPRIRLIDKSMSLHELYSLKMAINCYVSLHRSEGFGYGPAEAMALGKPVIMTNYSANTEFGDNDASFLVDCRLIHVLDGEYLYWTPEMKWAEPDVDIAASFMIKVYQDRELADSVASRGKQRILSEFGPRSMAEKYRSRLVELGLTHLS